MADYTFFKLRGNTRANWLAANPILNNRELAMETDTMRFKVGDGLATYSQLPYGRNTGEYLNFYNVTAFLPLPAGYYYTHDTAISKVVANERCKGLIVSYEVSSGVWYTERFIGSDVANWGVLANWEQMPDSSDFTALHDVITAYNNHALNKSNPHTVTKDQIGLGNAANTSDLDKPISTATQDALDNKVNVSGDQTIYGFKSFYTSPTVPNPTNNNDVVNKVTLDLHKNDSTNPHQVTKLQVGLGNADNTSDVNKPISTATQTALNLKENAANKGAVNGYASLDETGKVPTGQLPSYVDDVLEYANLASFPVSGEQGKIYVALDTNKTYRWSGSAYIYITSGAVDSVAGKTGVVSLVKGDVGLGNVDNTSDINKPVSTEQQTALNLKADKARQITAGSGLTGGGDLSADRTINVGATDDSIIVAADGIKVNTQNLLTSTSTTKPLAANQGTILDGKITQLGADLNTSVADEKSMFPAIAYNKRVLADGGTVISKQSVIDGYKTMIDLLPNTKLLFCPQAGVKTRTSGIYSYLSKAYDMGVNNFDLTQPTDANQPYLAGGIAPNESKFLKINYAVRKILTHTEIQFLATNSWSLLYIHKYNNKSGIFSLGTNLWVTISELNLTITMNAGAYNITVPYKFEVGKTYIISMTYLNGTLVIYINGQSVYTTSASYPINLVRIENNASYPLDFNIYYYQVLNKDLNKSEITNTYNYLRSQYPEIEGVNIGNQHWATSNYEGVVTGNGTVIPEVQDTAAWAALTTPAWCYYNNDPTLGSVYGKLYNYYAVQEIAKNPPKGWRVSSREHFVQLSTYLGGWAVAGGKLKAKFGGFNNINSTNESGFTLLQSGYRNENGDFIDSGDSRSWVNTTFDVNNSQILYIMNSNAELAITSNNIKRGYQFRLLRNSPVGDQTQNISTGVFTTNIAAGIANKDLSIPFGYEVKAINVMATTAITNFKCDLLNTSGVLQQNLVTGKSVSANVPIKFGVSADANIQYTDPILRFNCTGNSGSGMEIQVILNKIL